MAVANLKLFSVPAGPGLTGNLVDSEFFVHIGTSRSSPMNEDPVVRIPFAVVDEITVSSSASVDVLQLGDEIIKFGNVENGFSDDFNCNPQTMAWLCYRMLFADHVQLMFLVMKGSCPIFAPVGLAHSIVWPMPGAAWLSVLHLCKQRWDCFVNYSDGITTNMTRWT